jgi:hypothetical protein
MRASSLPPIRRSASYTKQSKHYFLGSDRLFVVRPCVIVDVIKRPGAQSHVTENTSFVR